MHRQYPCAAETVQPSAAGFSLIEVMVALAILGIGILAMTALQIRAINQNAAARIQSEATYLAGQHLEMLKTLPFDHDLLSAEAEFNPHQQAMGACGLEWTVTTPALQGSVYSGLPVKLVNLRVDCANPNAQPLTFSFVRGQAWSF